jgi:hypothetical protein
MNDYDIESFDNKHKIKLQINNDCAIFSIINLEFEFYKSFLILLKDIIHDLNSKNIKNIIQYINNDDCVNFNKSDIIKIDDNTSMVVTNINIFAEQMYEALGILHPVFH